jgi:hypothetical protein
VTGPATGTTDSSVWVGIDGFGGNTVEQVGTEEDVVNGTPLYRAWWEMYSTVTKQPEQVISSLVVSPGDSISASVQYITSGTHAGQFLLSINDTSQSNDSFSIYETSAQTQNPAAQRNSAEWIVEAPTVNGSISAVANFGTVNFTNASAVINGVSGPINSPSWQSTAVNLVSNGVTRATTSVLGNSGTSFSVTYNSSGSNGVQGAVSGGVRSLGLPSNSTFLLAIPLNIPDPQASVVPFTGFGSLNRSFFRPNFRPAQAIESSINRF